MATSSAGWRTRSLPVAILLTFFRLIGLLIERLVTASRNSSQDTIS